MIPASMKGVGGQKKLRRNRVAWSRK